jgi:[acyl-carrier-protein] S-malonyltransferase
MWWAGALDTETALRLGFERSRLMARDSAACDGTMVAVLGLGEAELVALCDEASQRSGAHAQVANLNAPGQVVLSGDRAALGIASALAQAAGARRVLPLNVGGPFHSVYMGPAAHAFRGVVDAATLQRATTPVILNTSATPATDPAVLRDELATQITRSVRWEDSVQTLARLGCDTILELGPGQVLTGLVRRILPNAQALAGGTPEALAKAASVLRPEA